ncbi:MAG: glycosyltransferase family 2 protein [Cyanobacteriota bacterium]|nr:glycosyltransferase family 2 protein [Cyanobacteriota bacterium]
MTPPAPWLSLIIGSRNEGDHLERTLTAAFSLDPPDGGLEASVLDDASSDGSSAFCDRDPWLERRRQGQLRLQRVSSCLGVSGGRRQAARGCRGEVLVFLDAHLEFPQPDLWRQLQQRFSDPGCDLLALDCYDTRNGQGTAGHVYTSRRLCHQQPAWVPLQDSPLVGVEVPFVNGGFFAIRRQVYARLEGFPDFLEGWGHEDRFLSMWAWLNGHRCQLHQDLRVGHLYKDAFADAPPGDPPADCSDPLPADGLQLPDSTCHHPDRQAAGVPALLMNSLRCAALLYDAERFAQCGEQLRFDYGPELMERGLELMERERPQLEARMQRLGLTAALRDQRLREFVQRFRPVLPMIDEAELQASAAESDPALALERVRRLPLALPSLRHPDDDHYRTARLYREACCSYQLNDFNAVVRLLPELLTIQPDYLPAITMLVVSLRALGRQAGARFWLEEGARIVDHHRASQGDGPLGPWHPACHHPYLRHLYWPAADRVIWGGLADLAEQRGERAEAIRWLGRLLVQHPEDPPLQQRLQALLHPDPQP